MAIGKTIGTYSKEYGQLRFLVKNDDLLVCVTDVARSLGYKRPNDAIRDHCHWNEKYTVPSINGGREYARFADWDEAIDFVHHCCLPGADEYEEFLYDLIFKYLEEYTSYSPSDDYDFSSLDEYDEDDDEDDDYDDYDTVDEYDPYREDDDYDKDTEILAVTKFVVLLVGMIIDTLYSGDWFTFNDQEPDVLRHKHEIAEGLMRMMDVADEVLDGMYTAA